MAGLENGQPVPQGRSPPGGGLFFGCRLQAQLGVAPGRPRKEVAGADGKREGSG